MIKYKYFLVLLIFIVFGSSCTQLVDSDNQNNTNWNTYDSEHYLIHVRPGGEAERSISDIRQEQEWAYNEIIDRLDANFNKKMLVYIYNSREDLGETESTGLAHPGKNTIETIYNNDIKAIGVRGVSLHELTHVIAYHAWCPTDVPLFSEGLAVYMDDYWLVPAMSAHDLHQISKNYLNQNRIPSVESMIENWDDVPAQVAYPVAGSFTKFLVTEYGLDTYRQLYCDARKYKYSSIFYDLYDKNLNDIQEEYRAFLTEL